MAHFDRAIPPGGEGKITLTVNTQGYHGAINKRIRVYTNDKKNSLTRLTIKAFVKVSIRLSPRSVNLVGFEGQEIKQSVQIRANEEKPLKLEPVHLFKVYFTNIPGPAGILRGVLRLKTNYPEKPAISISIKVRIRKTASRAKGKVKK